MASTLSLIEQEILANGWGVRIREERVDAGPTRWRVTIATPDYEGDLDAPVDGRSMHLSACAISELDAMADALLRLCERLPREFVVMRSGMTPPIDVSWVLFDLRHLGWSVAGVGWDGRQFVCGCIALNIRTQAQRVMHGKGPLPSAAMLSALVRVRQGEREGWPQIEIGAAPAGR